MIATSIDPAWPTQADTVHDLAFLRLGTDTAGRRTQDVLGIDLSVPNPGELLAWHWRRGPSSRTYLYAAALPPRGDVPGGYSEP